MTLQEVQSENFGSKPFLEVYIEMDDEVKTMGRKFMTFMDALKNAGGFMSVAFVGAMTLV